MKKFSIAPLTLYRIQPKLPVRLRSYDDQVAKGRASFDLKLHDGKVLPIKNEIKFETPNGMSLRPAGDNMTRILANFRGEPTVYTIGCGTTIPSHFALFHEHTDHYSLQTAEPVDLDTLNKRMTEFLETLPKQSLQQFIEQLEDDEDQDN